jgi:hypothetical protein
MWQNIILARRLKKPNHRCLPMKLCITLLLSGFFQHGLYHTVFVTSIRWHVPHVCIYIYTRISLWPKLLTNLIRQFCYTSKEELDVRLTRHNNVFTEYIGNIVRNHTVYTVH